MLEKEASVENEETSNIETTIEKKEVVVENVENIIAEENIEDTKEEIKVESKGLVNELLAGVLDQIVVALVALVTLLVFNLVLKIFGYYIAEKQPMFLIIYVIINIIYAPVCKKFKIKETLGKKVLLNK